MSDKTELAGLSVGDLAELTRGLYFLFWGLVVFVMALMETLVRPVLQPFPVLFLGASGVGTMVGAYRLYRLRALGPVWRRRARNLLMAAVLVDYLSLFYLMWRQLPNNAYLLAHTLLFFGMVVLLLGLLCPPVWHLTQAAARPNLAAQCAGFGAVALMLLVPADVLVTRLLVSAARQGHDPVGMLQFWLESIPRWATLGILLPVALLLSLLWTAKDLAHEALLAKSAPPAQPE